MIFINIGEELVDTRLVDGKTSSRKGVLKLVLIQLAVVVPVYAIEEREKLVLSLLHKGSEFLVAVSKVLLTRFLLDDWLTAILYSAVTI